MLSAEIGEEREQEGIANLEDDPDRRAERLLWILKDEPEWQFLGVHVFTLFQEKAADLGVAFQREHKAFWQLCLLQKTGEEP